MITLSGIIWNPNEGIDLSFFQIRFYSLMFVVAFSLGWYITKAIFDREKQSQEMLDKLFMYTVLGTLLGARLGHVFFYDWDYYSQHLVEILLPIRETANGGYEFTGFAGLASHGAAIAIISIMFHYSKNIIKKPVLWVLDRIVIPVASGAVFVRLGNFMNSEIIGKPADETVFLATKFIRGEDTLKPYQAMQLTQTTTPNAAFSQIENAPQFAAILNDIPFRYPAQLYEAICYVFVFTILFFMYWKTPAREKSGLLFGTFLVLLWTVRFFVEYVKESQGGFENALGLLSTGQWLSIPFICIGLFFMVKPFVKKAV